MSTVIPRIHLGEWVADVVNWLTDHWSGFFDGVASIVNHLVDGIQHVLMNTPIVLLVIIFALLALWARGWKAAILAVVGFALIDGFGEFPSAMETLSQIIVASVLAIVIAIPVGILAARGRRASAVIKPVLDFMQTLPAYVYLLPVLFLIGLGSAGAVLATIIFSIPPGVRLTELGIRQVDGEMVEAGQAFGATPKEVLRGIQIPLAMPSIMAGVNQVIMLALSMVVVAGIVGAPGLGQDVLSSLQSLDVGVGVEAGLSVVIMAIYLDRVTDGFSKPEVGLRSELATLRRRQTRAAAATDAA
ncbi:ABC transporter permease subunit [Flexivirga sp. ID2601S]|uniref:ABC transporter permease subunit n=1 Tax=Flexivirga aerilata TaxID=1656889 RepID=A0A849AIQ4_9MICO|nr:ABC transporter permease subunit [Flexivirga aerilata]NNG39717.1 ABC transporter permease subunit [Flexivirga aerilata]